MCDLLGFVYLSRRIVSPLGSWSVLPHPATTAVLFLVIWSYVGRQTAPLHIISTHCWTKTWNRKTLYQPTNQQGTKWAGKAYICPKMSIWGQKRPFFRQGAKFLLSTYQKTTYAPCSHCFLVGFGNKLVRKANQWPKITENAKFGRFWAREIKSFVTHITENPPRHLVRIDFWSGMGRNGHKVPIFGPKWPKMHILDQIRQFLAKNPNFYMS